MNKKENCQNSKWKRTIHWSKKDCKSEKYKSEKSKSEKHESGKSKSEKHESEKKQIRVAKSPCMTRTGMPFRKESKRSNGRKSNVMACSTVMTKKNRKSSIRLWKSAGITALTTLIFSSIRTVRHRRSSASTRPGWERECPIGRRF